MMWGMDGHGGDAVSVLHGRARAGWWPPVAFVVLSLLSGPAPARDLQTPFAATLLMEAGSGTVLLQTAGDRRWPPASMVKMMLMLLVAERVADGRLSWDDPVTTSARASRTGGSQVYLRHGEVFSLEEMVKAVAIASANDAAMAIAEHVAGSAPGFVELMNKRARELGLTDTVYQSVHGLPRDAGQEDDLSSAHDLARLARELLAHKDILAWTSLAEAPFRGGKFLLVNTNQLIRRYRGAVGLKTGHHRRAGYNLTATATRGDLTLIAVVLGAEKKAACADEAARLLTHGFSTYRVVWGATGGAPVGAPIPVKGGEVAEVRAIAGEDLRLVLERAAAPNSEIQARVPPFLEAPVRKGQPIGQVAVVSDGEILGQVELLAAGDVAAVGWLGRLRGWITGRQPGP